jgi:aminoglycoside phosphotransferase family enzyme
MDLDRYQQTGLSRHLVKCYRAYVRGKVESFKLDDPYIPEEEKTKVLAVAQSYFKLAESYV